MSETGLSPCFVGAASRAAPTNGRNTNRRAVLFINAMPAAKKVEKNRNFLMKISVIRLHMVFNYCIISTDYDEGVCLFERIS